MPAAHKLDGSMTLDMCHQFCQGSVNTYFGVEVREFNSGLYKLGIFPGKFLEGNFRQFILIFPDIEISKAILTIKKYSSHYAAHCTDLNISHSSTLW